MRRFAVLVIRRGGADRPAWTLWERWISEIVADFWSVAKLGIAATLGLIGVVSLPRAFVFRIALDDPHPVPWVRVVLSCAMGQALFADPQWGQLEALWRRLYPLDELSETQRRLLELVEGTMPEFVLRLASAWAKTITSSNGLNRRSLVRSTGRRTTRSPSP